MLSFTTVHFATAFFPADFRLWFSLMSVQMLQSFVYDLAIGGTERPRQSFFKHFCIEQTGDSIIIFCKHLTALVFSSCKQPLPSPITLLDHRVCTVQPLLITPVGDVPGWGLFSTVWLDCSDFESNLFKQTYIIWHTSGSKFRYLHILYDLETLLIIHFLFCRLRHTRF